MTSNHWFVPDLQTADADFTVLVYMT